MFTKKRIIIPMLLTLCMMLVPISVLAEPKSKDEEPEILPPAGNLDFDDAIQKDLTILLDGAEMKVTEYEDFYIPEPSLNDQRISIYIPEGATKESPVILCVNNAGWMMNSYKSRTKVAKDDPENLEEHSGNDDKDKVGMILANNYVLVSYGCRARNDDPSEGIYNGHSPATVTDTKAVIRYLRHNSSLLPAGDTDRIIITGTSGGGALSCVIGASGDSTDFLPYLYEIGAAGVSSDGDIYTSDISDSVYGVIAYCPITDLPNADAAYEWTYGDIRKELEGIDYNTNPDKPANIYYSEESGTLNEEISAVLTDTYAGYVDSLGLKLDDGSDLTGENLKDAITGLMEDEITESIEEIGTDQMLEDISKNQNGKDSVGPQDWLIFADDGSFTYDFEKHLSWVASNTKLKVVCAFSNAGLPWAATNEDSLFGAPEYAYSAFEEYSWNHDSVEGNGCGPDDTGMEWNEFLTTEAGADLALQMRMTNAIDYLNDNEGDDAGVKAPFWYVRYGMNDRDSSFAVETILRYSITNQPDIENADFEFTWLKPHSGDYDVTEAYAWLDSVLE